MAVAAKRTVINVGLMFVLFMGFVLQTTGGQQSKSFGSLMLCPPGGPDFVHAWDIACEMKRRKKRNAYDYFSSAKVYEPVDMQLIKQKRVFHGYRQATLGEIMEICCYAGCELRDLLAYCNPFDHY